MSQVVAIMRSWERLEGRFIGVYDRIADEVLEGLWYSFSRHKDLALEELPGDEAAPLQGPRNIKEVYVDAKKELLDVVDQIGRRLVTGVLEQLAVEGARPFSRVPEVMSQIMEAVRTLARMGSAAPTVAAVVVLGGRTHQNIAPLHHSVDEDDEFGGIVNVAVVQASIASVEHELERLNTESSLAEKIKVLNRLMWQSASLKNRLPLYLFHMSSFFWGLRETVKAGYRDEKINTLLWGATSVVSALELRKSSSFQEVFSLRAYTPEKLVLSTMKTMMIGLFIVQSCFMSFQNSGYQDCLAQVFAQPFKRACYRGVDEVECFNQPLGLERMCSQELDFSQKIDRVALNLFIAMGVSFMGSVLLLSLMTRGLQRKVQVAQRDLATEQVRLTARLEQLQGQLSLVRPH